MGGPGMRAGTAAGAEAAAATEQARTTARILRPCRFLLFNFFAGVYERGIPIYVQNLRTALERQGVVCREFRCPRVLRRLPKQMLNVAFVLCEQCVVPVLAFSCDRVLYPYNSVSVVDSIRGRAVLVVHDFVSASTRRRSFLARYIRVTQRIHGRLAGDVTYISRSTERIGRRLKWFPRSQTFLLPNSFFRFMSSLRGDSITRSDAVLLCTGWGDNKDLGGALKLYLESGLCERRPLRILGIAGHREAVDTFLEKCPWLRARVTVLPRLEDSAVGEEYRSAAWVWVHSKKEGYGRPIAEAKMCGCRVVASDIAPFREQRNERTFFYTGAREFERAWARCESVPAEPAPKEPCEPKEHALLAAELDRYLRANGFGHLNEAG
jgi:glycosyltransferase involved in cell wall biosynthesis